jgi:hypothetical protein
MRVNQLRAQLRNDPRFKASPDRSLKVSPSQFDSGGWICL